jgi:hypothetical protein
METFHDEYSAEYQTQHKAAWKNLDEKAALEKELSLVESACNKDSSEHLLKEMKSLKEKIKSLTDTISSNDEVWIEKQSVDYRLPNFETAQQNLLVTITSNDIQFAHGIEFVHYRDLADLLVEAQFFGEEDDTGLNRVIGCPRRLNIDPLCRLKFDQGRMPT